MVNELLRFILHLCCDSGYVSDIFEVVFVEVHFQVIVAPTMHCVEFEPAASTLRTRKIQTCSHFKSLQGNTLTQVHNNF